MWTLADKTSRGQKAIRISDKAEATSGGPLRARHPEAEKPLEYLKKRKRPLVDPCGQDIQRSKIVDDNFQSPRKGKPLGYEKIFQIVMQIIFLVLNLKHPIFWKDIPAKKKIKRERKKPTTGGVTPCVTDCSRIPQTSLGFSREFHNVP